ncbi:MAG: hypothetical protein HQL06_00015 [Nitrospirae bacterium]|nr:hypothetical protein [Nitrospirota bacterium]
MKNKLYLKQITLFLSISIFTVLLVNLCSGLKDFAYAEDPKDAVKAEVKPKKGEKKESTKNDTHKQPSPSPKPQGNATTLPPKVNVSDELYSIKSTLSNIELRLEAIKELTIQLKDTHQTTNRYDKENPSSSTDDFFLWTIINIVALVAFFVSLLLILDHKLDKLLIDIVDRHKQELSKLQHNYNSEKGKPTSRKDDFDFEQEIKNLNVQLTTIDSKIQTIHNLLARFVKSNSSNENEPSNQCQIGYDKPKNESVSARIERFINDYNNNNRPDSFKDSYTPQKLGIKNTEERYKDPNIQPRISEAGNGWYWGVDLNDDGKLYVVPIHGAQISEQGYNTHALDSFYDSNFTPNAYFRNIKLIKPARLKSSAGNEWVIDEKGRLELS